MNPPPGSPQDSEPDIVTRQPPEEPHLFVARFDLRDLRKTKEVMHTRGQRTRFLYDHGLERFLHGLLTAEKDVQMASRLEHGVGGLQIVLRSLGPLLGQIVHESIIVPGTGQGNGEDSPHGVCIGHSESGTCS